MLTQERLKQLLYYDPVTGIFTWRKNHSSMARAGNIAGYVAKKEHTKYIYIRVDNKLYLAHRLAFLYQTGKFPAKQVDHIDQNRTNNSWNNLRPASHTDNQRNRSKNKNNN